MRIPLALCALVALVLQIGTAPVTAGKAEEAPAATAAAQKVPASGPAKGAELAALEKKLLGAWTGPACAGDYTFKADGTFDVRHFTPGGNTLSGTWSVRWDALPPTLVLTCTKSDFKQKDPSRAEYEYLGKARELKLVELNGDAFVYRLPNAKFEWRNSRPVEE
jgi:hypothetical protein